MKRDTSKYGNPMSLNSVPDIEERVPKMNLIHTEKRFVVALLEFNFHRKYIKVAVALIKKH